MKLGDAVLTGLAKMVVGDDEAFPYRSSSRITAFFERCGFPYAHDGSTRKWWAKERLAELNLGSSRTSDLPSDDLLHLIGELFEPEDFQGAEKEMEPALEALNKFLKRAGLLAYLDPTGRCYLRNTGTGTASSALPGRPRPLSHEEVLQRQRLAGFLEGASEDEFTSRVLVPFFQRLGFYRVSAAGHKEKILEFGKDMWMKYQLPTGHWLYFCALVKREKIDSSAASGSNSVSTVLSQAKMAIEHPIFDPDANRKILLDHVFIISAGEITRGAKTWLVEHLDASQRRHIIFMDRDEFLDHSARILVDLRLEDSTSNDADDLPF